MINYVYVYLWVLVQGGWVVRQALARVANTKIYSGIVHLLNSVKEHVAALGRAPA